MVCTTRYFIPSEYKMSEKRATVVVDDTDDDHEHHHTINTPAMNSNASFATSGASTVSSVTFKKRDGTELPFALPISGPGLVVMLADSDAGSLIVSAQSGKVWGYALVPLQFVMVAPLFMAQELSVRLGVCSGKGLSNLIGHHFGKFWSSFISVLLVLICQAALISEYTAIVGVAEVVGIQKQTTIPLLSLFMFFTVAAGTYQQVETGALALGCMEFVFFITVIMVHPSPSTIVESIEGARWNDKDLQILAAANIGAIMQPWMIFYQQSAIVDKGVKTGSAMRHSQRETIYGAWITQAVAASVMITAAGTVWGGANASEKSAGLYLFFVEEKLFRIETLCARKHSLRSTSSCLITITNRIRHDSGNQRNFDSLPRSVWREITFLHGIPWICGNWSCCCITHSNVERSRSHRDNKQFELIAY